MPRVSNNRGPSIILKTPHRLAGAENLQQTSICSKIRQQNKEEQKKMEQLSTVVKSKSSNNGIPLKPKKNKKSISDVDFIPNLVKKRGVYVDRKVFKSPLYTQEANDYETNRRPPPRPRPGQKKFLASVLRILSKSTTGTQYPDIQDEEENKNSKVRTRSRLRHETDPRTEKPNKHGKYKSRILNRNIKNDDDQFIILQSTKQIMQTPSNYSDANEFSVPEEKTNMRSIRDILLNNGVAEIARDLLKEQPEKTKKDKTRNKDNTIASQIKKEGEKKIYNMFVDLLESTFNSYNLNDEILSESSTALEINESVATKLNFAHKLESNNLTTSTNKTRVKSEPERHSDEPINIRLSDHQPLKRINPRVSVKSYEHKKNVKTPEHSFPRKKRCIRNNRKTNLLNIFKDELQQKTSFNEPLNLFQALKVLAKNKRKKNFYEKKKHTRADIDRHECVFKRRKIISMKPKKISKIIDRDTIGQKYSEYNSRFKKREKNTTEPSQHSLKVFEYYFEDKNIPHVRSNERLTKETKTSTVTEKFSPFIMHSNLDYYTLLQFPDRSTYNFTY